MITDEVAEAFFFFFFLQEINTVCYQMTSNGPSCFEFGQEFKKKKRSMICISFRLHNRSFFFLKRAITIHRRSFGLRRQLASGASFQRQLPCAQRWTCHRRDVPCFFPAASSSSSRAQDRAGYHESWSQEPLCFMCAQKKKAV